MAMHARHCDRRLAVPLLLLWRVRARWHEEQEKLYFNVWFLWLFVLGTITVYGRLQANTFLGMVLYGFLTGNPAEATDHIWKETSTFHISLEAILLVMAFAQICHYAFGVLSYCPRWAKTAAHKRWQYGKNGGLGRWSPWGRSFEFEVKGIATADEHITDMSRWQQWMDGFEGATAMVTTSSASSANGKDVFITVPRGGPAKTGKGEYTPSDADFPISVQWTTNRHAYTTLFGEEMMHGASRASAAGQGSPSESGRRTSSTVMDVIAECCSMGILLEMQCLELHEHAKAAGHLTKYEGEDTHTEKMSGELIQAVRALMNSAVTITRCVFSRVFIYGVCFCGTYLHFQTTYANVLCVGSASESCNGAKALWVGIGAAFVSMLLVLAKIVSIAKYPGGAHAGVARGGPALLRRGELLRRKARRGQDEDESVPEHSAVLPESAGTFRRPQSPRHPPICEIPDTLDSASPDLILFCFPASYKPPKKPAEPSRKALALRKSPRLLRRPPSPRTPSCCAPPSINVMCGPSTRAIRKFSSPSTLN
ncbi:unnamed protein product [Prorocentrum cordatum]|uniref:Uncharacterized protein n=1 Tax=Prorocentrum cordatum TaxID=2364126 RepID=A0ABN9PJ65_9DINO|nr:unnamed protein product [Polarella glacialis]